MPNTLKIVYISKNIYFFCVSIKFRLTEYAIRFKKLLELTDVRKYYQ